jgi:protein phosphatase
MAIVQSAGITAVGKKRKGNEDAFFFNDAMRFYVVADGMGGHKAGEVASQMLVEALQEHMQKIKGESKADDMTYADGTLSKEANHLVTGIHQANQAVHERSQSSSAYQGMGSTVSAAYLTDETLIVSNVGDSPIYLIREGAIETISVLHTWAAEHAVIAPEGSKPLGKQFQHMLTQAIGVDEAVKPDTREIPMLKGDIVVICSDGLSDNVSPEEIRDIVLKEQPHQACQTLVDLSNEIRGHDNITVIVLKIKALTVNGRELDLEENGIESAEDLPPPKSKIAVEYDTEDGSYQNLEENGIESAEALPPPKSKITVEYDTEDGSYQSFVQSINLDRVLIETGESFAVGQDVFMSFSFGDEQTPLMLNGKVADRSSQGIEVKFEQLSQQDQEMIKSIMEKL